jgi:hypothetical protein
MNFKCKIIFNIFFFNILIVHVVIDNSTKNHIEKYGWIPMNLWYNNNAFVMYIIFTCVFKKHDMVLWKLKLKNNPTQNEMCKSKIHWNFLDGCKYVKRSQHGYFTKGLWILFSLFHMKEFWMKFFATCY